MALNRKYDTLPDLDSAPDTYETPSLTDDNSTAPRAHSRTSSASSHYTDFSPSSSSPGSPVISRSHLNQDAARALFEPARIDATGADFSERLVSKRRGYKSSSRRAKNHYGDDAGGNSDEEETLERRVARLRREIEEVKELARRSKEEGSAPEDSTQDAAGLSRLLDDLELDSTKSGSAERLQKSLAAPLPKPTSATIPRAPTTKPPVPEQQPEQTQPSAHVLAQTADFDSRLANLESSLGLPTMSLLASPPPPMLPTLDGLAKKLAMLSSMTPAQLDALSRRVRALTTDTEKLAAAKAAARKRGPTLSDSTEPSVVSDDAEAEGGKEGVEESDEMKEEMESRINALYGTLGTIERLAPLLPGVLERLRTLRVVHQGAATKSQEIEEALQKQVSMGFEIQRWAEGLERVEKAVRKGEETGMENVRVVEGWVRELEERLLSLSRL